MEIDRRVRLLPADLASTGVVRPFAEGIVQTITVRGVDGDRQLDDDIDVERREWASAWALTQMLERPREINTIDASGSTIIHLFSDSDYCASSVPFLGDIIDGDDRIGAKGALVAMPLAHSVLVHPISDASVVRAAQALVPITRQVHRSGPNRLSPHVYWWRDGALTWVPTTVGRHGVEFHAPNGLADLIARQD